MANCAMKEKVPINDMSCYIKDGNDGDQDSNSGGGGVISSGCG